MSTIPVVLLGAGGQLGKTITADWQQGCESHTTAAHGDRANTERATVKLHSFDRAELDICQPEQLTARLGRLEPRFVVNAAAYTQVDNAESEADRAFRINRDGTANIAEWVAGKDCRLIHLSTDFVFDGKSSTPYAPEHSTAPVNAYGSSKLAGETAIRRIVPDGSLIVRTGWLYSRFQPNFVTTMLRLMTERDRLQVVADQIGSPTSTHSLARLIRSVISHDNVVSGTLHWSDAGVASWYDFAVAIQEEALEAGLLRKEIPIEPISTVQYPTPAARPPWSVLDKSASYERLAMEAIHWRKELRRVIAEICDATETDDTKRAG